ncbi:hypothetical protein D9M71_648790 [compost metagenome]
MLANSVLLLLYEVSNAGFEFLGVSKELITLVLILKLVGNVWLIAVMRRFDYVAKRQWRKYKSKK